MGYDKVFLGGKSICGHEISHTPNSSISISLCIFSLFIFAFFPFCSEFHFPGKNWHWYFFASASDIELLLVSFVRWHSFMQKYFFYNGNTKKREKFWKMKVSQSFVRSFTVQKAVFVRGLCMHWNLCMRSAYTVHRYIHKLIKLILYLRIRAQKKWGKAHTRKKKDSRSRWTMEM